MQLVKAKRVDEANALMSFAPVLKAEMLKRKPEAERVLRKRDVQHLVSHTVVKRRLQEIDDKISAAGGPTKVPEELVETKRVH